MLGQLEPGSPLGDWLISMRVLPPPSARNGEEAGQGLCRLASPPSRSRRERGRRRRRPATGPREMPSGPHGKASEPAPTSARAASPPWCRPEAPKRAPPPASSRVAERSGRPRPAPAKASSNRSRPPNRSGRRQPLCRQPPRASLAAPCSPRSYPESANTTTARLARRDAGARRPPDPKRPATRPNRAAGCPARADGPADEQ